MTNAQDTISKTYTYRLYPSNQQQERLCKVLNYSRRLFNNALKRRRRVYRETGKIVTAGKQAKSFLDLRSAKPRTYGLLSISTVKFLLERIDGGYAFHKWRCKRKIYSSRPKRKLRLEFVSIPFAYGDDCRILSDPSGRIFLQVHNVGRIKVKYHRPLPAKSRVKQILVRKDQKYWYVDIVLDIPVTVLPKPNTPAIGIDVGIANLLALSDGRIINNPSWLKANYHKIVSMRKSLARKKRRSKRYKKALCRLEKLYKTIDNQRRDFWHKITRQLVNQYGFIAAEKLPIDRMKNDLDFGISIRDSGWEHFFKQLRYKAKETGTRVVFVSPAYTSQYCSQCHSLVEKDLGIRVHACPKCGLTIDRDVNAARNILKLGLDQAWTEPSGDEPRSFPRHGEESSQSTILRAGKQIQQDSQIAGSANNINSQAPHKQLGFYSGSSDPP